MNILVDNIFGLIGYLFLPKEKLIFSQVANVKHAAVRKESKRVDDEKQYRQKLEQLFIDSDNKTKEELKAINAGWEGLRNIQNPLEINRGTSFLRGRL